MKVYLTLTVGGTCRVNTSMPANEFMDDPPHMVALRLSPLIAMAQKLTRESPDNLPDMDPLVRGDAEVKVG